MVPLSLVAIANRWRNVFFYRRWTHDASKLGVGGRPLPLPQHNPPHRPAACDESPNFQERDYRCCGSVAALATGCGIARA